MTNSSFRDTVGAKLTAAKGRLMANGIRNGRGFNETADRIRKGAENLYFSLGNEHFEPVSAMYEAFSERPGIGDTENVKGVDIIDINILATQQSIMGYLCAERGMDKRVDVAFYQTLQAMNNAGGFAQGDTVFTPWAPISSSLNLGAVIQSGTIDAGKVTFVRAPLAKKGVTIVAANGGIGTDDGKGNITWDLPPAGLTAKATVNYETGVVSLPGVAAADLTSTTATLDRTAEKDGEGTLKVKPRTSSVTIEAEPRRVILENSFEDNAVINKQAYNLASIGVSMDFGKRAVAQLLQVYTYFLDLMAVKATWEAMQGQEVQGDFDYTPYNIGTSEASTKNDIVNSWMLQLSKDILKRTGRGPNVYLVDTEGAALLGNNPLYFVPNAQFDNNLNGMIGTYRGIPVIRHYALDGQIDALKNDGHTYAFIGGLYKSADGQIAPSIFAEYLPPYSVTPALNFDNPSQYSQALLSMNTTKVLIKELCSYIAVKMI
jgi:hypothetical protein